LELGFHQKRITYRREKVHSRAQSVCISQYNKTCLSFLGQLDKAKGYDKLLLKETVLGGVNMTGKWGDRC
jgi:hypothetical protein